MRRVNVRQEIKRETFLVIRVASVFIFLYAALANVMLVVGLDRIKELPKFFWIAYIVWPLVLMLTISGIRAGRIGGIGLVPLSLFMVAMPFISPKNDESSVTVLGSIGFQVFVMIIGLGILYGSFTVLSKWKDRQWF